jgi:hypothetical protein
MTLYTDDGGHTVHGGIAFPIEPDAPADDEGPGMFLSAGFWAGGLLSLAAWSAIWVSVAWLLDRI